MLDYSREGIRKALETIFASGSDADKNTARELIHKLGERGVRECRIFLLCANRTRSRASRSCAEMPGRAGEESGSASRFGRSERCVCVPPLTTRLKPSVNSCAGITSRRRHHRAPVAWEG
jgi:hypothetical protein